MGEEEKGYVVQKKGPSATNIQLPNALSLRLSVCLVSNPIYGPFVSSSNTLTSYLLLSPSFFPRNDIVAGGVHEAHTL